MSTHRPARRVASARKKRPVQTRALSPQRKPDDIDTATWQRGLRRQFGRSEAFKIENTGSEPVFSEFLVQSAKSHGRYRVAIRGTRPGDNYCACPDFATNDLGTCKHVEAVLARLERRRGGARALAAGYAPPYSEVYVRYGVERRIHFRAGTTCPAALRRRAGRLFDDGHLPTARFDALPAFLEHARKSGHEVRCYDDVFVLIAEVRDRAHRHTLLAAEYPDGAASPTLAKLLRVPLYPYQAEGALFAARAGRALIADEMGLGKTVQAIAATELFARHFGAEKVLIVCPASLQHQWQRELDRFAGRATIVVGGGQRTRAELYAADASPCRITNYEKLAADLDAINGWSPDVVIVDEAQRIKNWNTVAAKALKRIESPYAVVLTGTPLENRLEELVSIVQFVDPHRLGPTWRLRHDHQVLDDGGRVVGYRDLNRIGAALDGVLLRRRKADVLSQLPARVDNTVFVELTTAQRDIHQSNATLVQQIVTRWRRTGYLSDLDQRRLMSALQNMRMVCNSTFLLDGRTDHGHKADELVTLLTDLFERPDAKAVVFSQWVRTHELLARRFRKHGWDHVVFHGGIPSQRRGALVDRFHHDPACRVFLATDAGGVGLNLQHAAATVVNMDLPWNPAVLEQRIGRVHRLGQVRGVQVVNFVARDAIEENMLGLLAFKQSVFAGVLDDGADEVFLDGTRLSSFMQRVEQATTTQPKGAREAPKRAPPAGSRVVRGGAAAAVEPASAAAGGNPWLPLLEIGMRALQVLASATNPADSNGQPQAAGSSPSNLRIERDAATGATYIRLRTPDRDVLDALTKALSQVLEGMSRPQ